jgi:ribonuclease HI
MPRTIAQNAWAETPGPARPRAATLEARAPIAYRRVTNMPWARAVLRGQKVLARVREDGSFDAVSGRVEIRYKPTDPRAYRAAAANLSRVPGEPILPDDACVPGEEPPERDGQRGSAKGAAKKKTASARAAQTIAAVPKDAWTVYADGACSGNPGPAGLGIVIVDPEGARSEGYEYLGVATNNIAELTAILRAAELVPSAVPAVVHTDSQYSIGVLTKGWKPKANQELIATIKGALKSRSNWRFQYVPGHAGVPLNERADELARQAVQTRGSRLPTPQT